MKKYVFTCGGTAGHINPAISIANEIKNNEPNSSITFIGTPSGMESTLVKQSGFDFFPIKVLGFRRKLSFGNIKHNLKAMYYLSTSMLSAKRLLKKLNPDVVIGTGGYVSGPIVSTASKMKIKTLIHEQNAFPGVTTKLLARKATAVCLAVEGAKKYLSNQQNIHITGNPIRQNILSISKEQAKKTLNANDKLIILSFGGSLGADIINQAAFDIINWANNKNDVLLIHSAGKINYDKFVQRLNQNKIDIKNNANLDIRPYINNMDICLAAADIVICRAGAISLSELCVTATPSILIPSPYVAENHQYFNAMELVNKNAAFIIEEKKYTTDDFIKILNKLYNDKELLKALSENALKLAEFNSTKKIYNIILSMFS